MKPFRIEFKAQPLLTLDQFFAYAKTCEGLPRLVKKEPHGGKLAIVGGSPSLSNHLEELKNWPGEIWAINNTAAWLLRHGIESTFITVDPAPVETFDCTGVRDALLASFTHPKLREKFEKVQIFDLYEYDKVNGIKGATTTASRACSLGIHQGFFDITLFGCEGSFEIGADHADRSENSPDMFVVKAGDKKYVTYSEYMMQSESLSKLILLAPNVFKQKSGGLLQGMIENPDTWEIVAVSETVKRHLIEVNGDSKLYDVPYEISA